MNKIKEVLSAQGRSQQWLADQLDIDKTAVWKYCANERQPSSPRLGLISEILEVQMEDLIVKKINQ